ncbi:MAG: hypothetical protein ABJF10_03000 [Chthoniobacter sp.]
MTPEREARIAAFLAELGADGAVTEELLRYNQSEFVQDERTHALRFPLADEPFVATWERYMAEAAHAGVFPTLRTKLVQLAFPISQGVSTAEAYVAATRRGMWPALDPDAGLQLVAPEALEMQIYATPAGRLPIVVARERADFETLLCALTKRNEPAAVPPSQGACMVAGYNNWDRIADLRRQWESGALAEGSSTWDECFARLQPRKELYQDRFILLSDGGYSGVTASSLGLDEAAWRGISLAIRREHECAHYFTKRVFQSMRNLLLDEVIADFMGVRAAAKGYRADWFLRFMGLEDFPSYRAGGRLQNYLGTPPLSTEAFRMVSLVVKLAAEQLQTFDRHLPDAVESSAILLALTDLSLLELAMPEAPNALAKCVAVFGDRRTT